MAGIKSLKMFNMCASEFDKIGLQEVDFSFKTSRPFRDKQNSIFFEKSEIIIFVFHKKGKSAKC